MKTDRELLELAAKAAGYEVKPHCNYKISNDLIFTHQSRNWNPLTDDGDALRLAVKLRITIHMDGSMTEAESPSVVTSEAHLGDPYAATRRCITRAAAEIGEAK